MITLISSKTLAALRSQVIDKDDQIDRKNREHDRLYSRVLAAERRNQRDLYDERTGALYSSLVGHLRQRGALLEAENVTLLNTTVRLQLHNQALRDALTALGGAVIELQDNVEVKA